MLTKGIHYSGRFLLVTDDVREAAFEDVDSVLGAGDVMDVFGSAVSLVDDSPPTSLGL